jgi:phage tail-like protein
LKKLAAAARNEFATACVFALVLFPRGEEMAGTAEPLEDFSFLVNWGGTRTGMLRVSPLRWSTSVVDHRSGSNVLNPTQKAPGLTAYQAITLEREIVPSDTEFQSWAGEVANAGSTFRRDITITLLDRQHNPAVVFQLRNCGPSAYEALSELNANTPGFALERLTLEYDWFVRTDV